MQYNPNLLKKYVCDDLHNSHIIAVILPQKMALQYHATLSESQKDIFQVGHREDWPNVVFYTFGIVVDNEYKLQIWDQAFEDWCNISVNSLPEKAKLRFVLDEYETESCQKCTSFISGESRRDFTWSWLPDTNPVSSAPAGHGLRDIFKAV